METCTVWYMFVFIFESFSVTCHLRANGLTEV